MSELTSEEKKFAPDAKHNTLVFTAPNLTTAIRQRRHIESQLSKFSLENQELATRTMDRLIPDRQWETTEIKICDVRPYPELEFTQLLSRLYTRR